MGFGVRVFGRSDRYMLEEQTNSSEQLLTGPVLVPTIGQVSAHNQRDLLLAQLLDGNLQRIRLALDVNQDRSVHTVISRQSISFSTVLSVIRSSRLSHLHHLPQNPFSFHASQKLT
jgi:hypothetical protein